MTTNRFLTVTILLLSVAAPAVAQSPEGGPPGWRRGGGGPHHGAGPGPGPGFGPRRPGDFRQHGDFRQDEWHHRSLVLSIALHHAAELGLSPQQVEALEGLRTELRRTAIRGEAERLIAEIDLTVLQRKDPVDMGQVEPKVREIERLRADRRLAALRAIEQGKAQLSAEQRAKLTALLGRLQAQRWREGGMVPPSAPSTQ